MNSMHRTVALTVVLLVAGSTLAIGPAVADEPACENNGGVVGVTQSDVIEGSVALYPGTEIKLGTCSNGSVQGFDASQLESHDGYEVQTNDGADRPTVRITGTAYPIDFSKLLDSTPSQGLTVTQPDATYHSQILDRTMAFDSADNATKFKEAEREYRQSVNTFENASTELEGTANEVDSSARLSAERIESANETLASLSTVHEAMSENASDLRNRFSGGTDSAAMYVGTAVTSDLTATTETGETAIDRYRQSVATHRAAARSTVLTYLGGPLLGGLLVGAILGAVVPLKQARNVEEQLRLSRNVEYSPRVALIPMLIGVLFAIGGLIVLWYMGGLSLVGILL